MSANFNALPYTIKQEILCHIDYDGLLDMKRVCSHWHTIIKHLLQIKIIDATEDGIYGKVKNCSWAFSSTQRSLCRVSHCIRNIINPAIIANVTDRKIVSDLHKTDHNYVISVLERMAMEFYDNLPIQTFEPCELVYQLIAYLTGDNLPVKKMEARFYEEETTESFLTAYEWYTCLIKETKNGHAQSAFISLYPDKRTFSVLIFVY